MSGIKGVIKYISQLLILSSFSINFFTDYLLEML